MAKDYEKAGVNKDGHYACDSMYAKNVREQNAKRDKMYSHSRDSHSVPSDMKGEHSNSQKGA